MLSTVDHGGAQASIQVCSFTTQRSTGGSHLSILQQVPMNRASLLLTNPSHQLGCFHLDRKDIRRALRGVSGPTPGSSIPWSVCESSTSSASFFSFPLVLPVLSDLIRRGCGIWGLKEPLSEIKQVFQSLSWRTASVGEVQRLSKFLGTPVKARIGPDLQTVYGECS